MNERNIWVISDTHFGHANIIKYCNRPFATASEMNDFMLTAWNETVKDGDIVYHLGDVHFNCGWIIPKLKGRKRLILGNHDDGKDKSLLDGFQKILMWRMFKEFGLLLTHVPTHPLSAFESGKVFKNVHGHVHRNSLPDPRYVNVSVEMTDYKPVNIEELRVVK